MQEMSTQSYKTQIKTLTFPGLAQSCSDQPGPGATLLGWPKSILLQRKSYIMGQAIERKWKQHKNKESHGATYCSV